MSFSQALSGLNAASTTLDVIGNNIANSQTVGFKSARTIFADVFAGAQAGLGTRVVAVQQRFDTGMLESSGRSLDLAISGEGFFRLVQNDEVVYSRNGQFTVNADGYLVNAQGARLTGYPAGVGTGGNPDFLRVPTGALQAQATNAVDAALNLSSASPAVAVPFDMSDAETYSYANNVTVFDSQGNAHNVTMYFTKVADNSWEVRLARGNELAPEVGLVAFNANGVLDTVTDADGFSFVPGGGVEDLEIALNLTGTTQFGGDFELSSVVQDGFASGSLVGVAIDNRGNITGNYSNQQSQILGTIVMASFSNMEGLRPVGDNAWVESSESGQPLLGMASSGRFGGIESGVVENSNVDLARELVNLIIAQRTYQANSQTIKVKDEVLQAAVNLR